MAVIDNLKNEINTNVTNNVGVRGVTAPILGGTLIDMVDTIDSTKADVSGYYESLEVGLADNLIPISTDVVNDSTDGGFIGRTTGGNATIPDVGQSQIIEVYGRWDNTTKTCFKPSGGFLSLSGNWFRPEYVISGYTINSSAKVVSGTGSIAVIPCVSGVSASGNNQGIVIEVGSGVSITRVAYFSLATGYPSVNKTGTLLTPSNGAYFPSGVGYLGIALTGSFTNTLYVHPQWSGYMNGIYVSPNESLAKIPMCDWGLSDLDYAYRDSSTGGKFLHQGRNKSVLSELSWTMVTNEGETPTYTWSAVLPSDAKSGADFKTDYTANALTQSGTTISFTSSSISTQSDLNTSLGSSIILYELSVHIETLSELSMNVTNSDFGGEFWLTDNGVNSFTISSISSGNITIQYGVDYLGWLRDDHKTIETNSFVTAQALDDINTRVEAITESISNITAPTRSGDKWVLKANGSPNSSLIPDGWDESLFGQWTGKPVYNGQIYMNISSSPELYIGFITLTASGGYGTPSWKKITIS